MIELLNPFDGRERVHEECVSRFRCEPEQVSFIRAPYRICPLGAHIDHQLGPVSAIAVNHGIDFAFVANDSRRIDVASLGYGAVSAPLDDLSRRHDWADYARGAVHALTRCHTVARGASIAVAGALAESGISSSAAVGLGYLMALAHANALELTSAQLIELDRVIENEFLGLKNGILDQSAIVLARENELTVIDCAASEHRYYSGPARFQFLAIYSGVKEPLVDTGKYNSRVEECLTAGAALRSMVTGTRSGPVPLGLTSPEEWRSHEQKLDELYRRRARHYFTECERVHEGAKAWERGDRAAFGELMIGSCLSSIRDYETGSPELIRLFEVLAAANGVYGARFSGAGFRGCAVALVEPGAVDSILGEIEARFLVSYPQFANEMWAFTSGAERGLRIL